MADSGSLWNISKEMNENADIQEAANAEKEYEELLSSRTRIKMPSTDIDNNESKSNSKPRHRRALSKQETFDPKSSRMYGTQSRQRRSATNDLLMKSPHKQLHSTNKPSSPSTTTTSKTPPKMFRGGCEYKKPSTLLRTPDFKSRFIVIDTKFKFMRIYRDEQELKNRQPFKYELPLKNVKVNVKNVQNKKKCIILDIKKQQHAFYFNDDSQRQEALESIKICNGQSKSPTNKNENEIQLKLFRHFDSTSTHSIHSHSSIFNSPSSSSLHINSLSPSYDNNVQKMKMKIEMNSINENDMMPDLQRKHNIK